ncbi:MAG: hypothetical protein A2017_08935 [Lentisphaerae bacterium GWF2_44_16]|nr:MAG: hypothetical protein A2017_08935 [Lentisphaerae bacterium GWF2_44_16]
MKSSLAINGGKKIISDKLAKSIPSWPPIYPDTAEKLKDVYLHPKWSFNGPNEQLFSKKFAKYHTAEYGIFMANGTVTLECALHALGVGKGDEVIVPALTWIATAMAVIYVGATPVFVDIEEDTLCLDPEKIKKAITPKTKALIPVHLYGSMADMEKIMAIAKKHNLYVIEDCAHAHGGVWNGKGVGSIGHVGSFSFQESKTLSSGEGGICLTNDPVLKEKIFRIKHIGYAPNTKQGEASYSPQEGLICHNYRGTEFQAVVLLGGLKRLKAQTKKREQNATLIRKLLKNTPGIKVQSRGRLADIQGYYMLTFILDTKKLKEGITRKEIMEALSAEGFGTGLTYGPVYKHALWNIPKSKYRIESNEVAEDLCSNRAICMSQSKLLAGSKYIKAACDAVNKVMKEYCK